MRQRYRQAVAALPKLQLRFSSALRDVFKQGYGGADLKADLLAGATVGIVALPLSMALAIASGVPPQHGLYTAIVAGGLIALLGGAHFNVSGPTAAFVVILAPISVKYGIGGLMLASVMAGVILVLMGASRLGKLVSFVPHPVTTGFTTGIAVVIATLQVKDFLGLEVTMPEHYTERVVALARALPTVHFADLSIGAFTLATLLIWPRLSKRLPAPLFALALAAVAAAVLQRLAPGFDVATIGDRFSYVQDGVRHAGIPQVLPVPGLPWHFPGGDGKPLELSLGLVRSLVGPATVITMLGAIESLLCAVVADGMTGKKHDPDVELMGQGIGNIVAPFFGGFAATGAIARTATNVRAGARSPLAAAIHAVFVLGAVLALAPLLGHLPMAALAALLLLVAWRMGDIKHFAHMLRVAPNSDFVVLLTCFVLTVLFDMVVSVSVGIVLASLLFMRRMADISAVRLSTTDHPTLKERLPPGVLLYEIAGPFFFGSTEKAMAALDNVSGKARFVILHMGAVPAMDVTGLVALESALAKLANHRVEVIISGVQEQPAQVLARAGIRDEPGKLAICPTLDEAVGRLRKLTA